MCENPFSHENIGFSGNPLFHDIFCGFCIALFFIKASVNNCLFLKIEILIELKQGTLQGITPSKWINIDQIKQIYISLREGFKTKNIDGLNESSVSGILIT